MKEALVSPFLEVKIDDTPIPILEPGEVVIKVICAGCNPKDWKYPAYSKVTANSGDDVAGVVAEVGENVVEFRPGDRVAAFHQMRARGGAFAEYAIAPATTTFHIPGHITFEEVNLKLLLDINKDTNAQQAATIPLASFTAAIALYHNLDLPLPWKPSTAKLPLLIYGGGSAIGMFAIKLALKSNLHPLIVVAGKSLNIVEPMLDSSKGDTVVDYRAGPDAVVQKVQKALAKLDVGPPLHAFDTISEKGSFQTLAKLVAPNGHITVVLPEGDYTSIQKSIQTSLTYVGVVHTEGPDPSKLKGIRHVAVGDAKDMGFIFSRYFGRGLQEGWLSGHPHELIPHGLNGLPVALCNLRDGKASAVKYVIRPGETTES
jgi:NADPH2:quinone reductase